MEPFLRTAYNYDMNEAGNETAIDCTGDPGKTQQQFRDDADINTIVERFGITGTMPQVLRLPQPGDFTGVFDFQTAMNAVVETQRTFMTLTAKVRSRFENDPQQLFDFLQDPQNKDEAIFLGLVDKPAPPAVESTGALPTAPEQAKTGAPTPPNPQPTT